MLGLYILLLLIDDDSRFTLFFDGDYEILLRHEAVFGDVSSEPPTEMILGFQLIIKGAMVIVGVREDTVDPSSNRAKSLDRVLLHGDAAGEVFVAVEKRGSTMEGV